MTSCSQTYQAEADTGVTALDPEDAHAFHGRAGVEFVDPRPAEAIAASTGLIPGARVIGLDRIAADDLPPAFADRSIHVITSCQAGPMAARAAAEFARLGFKQVSFVDGGTQAWVDAGFATTR